MNYLVIAVASSLVIIIAAASYGYVSGVKEAPSFYTLASLLVGGVLGYLTKEIAQALGNKTTDTTTTTTESTDKITNPLTQTVEVDDVQKVPNSPLSDSSTVPAK